MKRKAISRYVWTGILMPLLCMAVAIPCALAVEPDAYEEDDTSSQPSVLNIDDKNKQHHNFHYSGDLDWAVFYGVSGEIYVIKASNLGSDCDVVITLYDSDGTTILREMDDYGKGEMEELTIGNNESRDGFYYVMIHEYYGAEGDNTEYDLNVYTPKAPFLDGFMTGAVESSAGEIISYATVVTKNGGSAVSWPGDGAYYLNGFSGLVGVTVQAPGFNSLFRYVDISVETTLDFILKPAGATLPTVTTTPVFSITSNSATTGGNVTSEGGGTVTAKGVCWNTAGNPKISDGYTSDGTGAGGFTSYLTGLTPGTLYYVRAYAMNAVGTAYGTVFRFTTKQNDCPDCPSDGIIENARYTSGNDCKCSHDVAITIGPNVTIESGATVTFTAPKVNFVSQVHAENGAGLRIEHP